MSEDAEYRFISSDSHIYEPLDLWTSRMPAKFRERAPRVDSKSEGDYYVIDGVPPMPVGVAGAILEQKIKSGMVEQGLRANRHTDTRPQASDPTLRLTDQDLDNVRAEIIYPNSWELRIYNAPDAEYAQACVQTYNDWLAEFCAVAPNRLIGAALLTCKGPIEWSIEEAKRVAKKGFRTVHIPVDVVEKPYSSFTEHYEPLWQTLEDLGLVVSTHIGATTGEFALAKIGGGAPVGLVNAVMRIIPQTLGHFLSGGILMRHPKLRVVMVECGIGWIPSVLQFMDKYWKINRKWMLPELPEPPGFYFNRQMYATFEGSKQDVAARQFLSVERFLWGNDYPHVEGTFPGSRKDVETDFAGIPEEDVRKMTFENAAKLYGI